MEKKGSCFFEAEEFSSLTDGLELAQCMLRGKHAAIDPDSISPEVSKQLEDLVIADAHSCSCCSVKFPDPTAQRAHFKLDWHRYNIKRQLAGLSPVREEAFGTMADDGDEIESISGSESESEEETKDDFEQAPHRHAKVFFRNSKGQVISLYRCLLSSSKDGPESGSYVDAALQLVKNDKWAVIMLGGGHFAAGIFKGQEALVHKTFHCYTVRAKQGGSQSTRDSKGGSHPKSAGASLRRYNEQALIQHVQELISSWADHFSSSSIIFYRAVGPHNRSVLFGGKNPPLDKTDNRLRKIPFPTRRATYKEVQRVHGMLSFIEIHGLESEFQSNYPPSPERKYTASKEDKSSGKKSDDEADAPASPRRSKVKGGIKPNRAKSRPSPQRPLPGARSQTSSEGEACGGGEEMSESEVNLVYEDTEIKFSDNVVNFENLVKNDVKKKREKVKQKNVPTCSLEQKPKGDAAKEDQAKIEEAEKKLKIAEKKARKKAIAMLRKQQEEEEAAKPLPSFQKELLAALQSGDKAKLGYCLSEFRESLTSELPGGLEEALNLPISEGNNTALHIASRSGMSEMISELLASGADPTIWNKKCQTPFGVASNKEVKKAFQDFLLKNPDNFDYSKAQIPLPLTEEEAKALADRKAAQRKAKREKEKLKQKAKAEEKAEQEEKNRFMALSDREKRALAAERRILAAQARGTVDESKQIVLVRCFTCGIDVSGQVTFEYNSNRFCTIECLKAHRMKGND